MTQRTQRSSAFSSAALAPGLTAEALMIAARLLPKPAGSRVAKDGAESES
jgi:hypothetical protein